MGSIITLRPDDEDEKLIDAAKMFYSESAATKTIMKALQDAPTYYKLFKEAEEKIEELKENLEELTKDYLIIEEAKRRINKIITEEE